MSGLAMRAIILTFFFKSAIQVVCENDPAWYKLKAIVFMQKMIICFSMLISITNLAVLFIQKFNFFCFYAFAYPITMMNPLGTVSTLPFASAPFQDFWQTTPLEDFLRPSAQFVSPAIHKLMNVDLIESRFAMLITISMTFTSDDIKYNSIYVGPHAYTLYCDIPGVVESDIDISYDTDFITIRAKRTRAVHGTLHRNEREFGSHHRRVRMPVDCDKDSAKATFCNGVLTIVFHKVATGVGNIKRIQLS